MYVPPRHARARAIALPRPQSALLTEWIVAVVAVGLILAGLLAS